MSPTTHDGLRILAHRAMAWTPSPTLRFQAQGRHEIRDGVALNATDLPGPSFNFAAVLGPGPSLDGVLALANAFFAGRPDGYGVLVEGDAGHPLEAELRARGWQVFEDEPALVMPVIPAIPAPPTGLTVRRVTDVAGLREFCDTVCAIFNPPPEVAETPQPNPAMVHNPDLVYLIGDCDGQAVATAQMCSTDGIAVVAGVATKEAYRRRGFGTAITWAAIREGVERGCTSAALRSGPMSFNLYVKMGFVPACKHRTYVPPAASAGS